MIPSDLIVVTYIFVINASNLTLNTMKMPFYHMCGAIRGINPGNAQEGPHNEAPGDSTLQLATIFIRFWFVD